MAELKDKQTIGELAPSTKISELLSIDVFKDVVKQIVKENFESLEIVEDTQEYSESSS